MLKPGPWILCGALLSPLATPASTEPNTPHTFYVDSRRGADGADGLTAGTAWRSLDRVNHASLRPGDTVLFRRGAVWRGQLQPQSGNSTGTVTYGAFGRGPKPILLGSVAMDRREDWRAVGERVWSTVTTGCRAAGGLSVDVGNIIFDDGRSTGTKKWQEDDLTAEGDFFYDAANCEVKLRSEGNPAARHKSVELALTRHIVDESGRSYVAYDNLDLRFGAAHGIGGGGVHHVVVRDCHLSFIGGGRHTTTGDGDRVRFGNGIEFWGDASDCLVEGCTLSQIYDAAVTNQGAGRNVQENITYRRNVISRCEYSFEFWNGGSDSRTRNVRFEHNTCVDAGFGWGHKQRPDPNGRHLMFYKTTATTESIVIAYNIFHNATDSCVRFDGSDWTHWLDMDYNCWFNSNSPALVWGTTQIGASGFIAFQRKHGMDAHSLVADPEFVNRKADDYRLTARSLARRMMAPDGPPGAFR